MKKNKKIIIGTAALASIATVAIIASSLAPHYALKDAQHKTNEASVTPQAQMAYVNELVNSVPKTSLEAVTLPTAVVQQLFKESAFLYFRNSNQPTTFNTGYIINKLMELGDTQLAEGDNLVPAFTKIINWWYQDQIKNNYRSFIYNLFTNYKKFLIINGYNETEYARTFVQTFPMWNDIEWVPTTTNISGADSKVYTTILNVPMLYYQIEGKIVFKNQLPTPSTMRPLDNHFTFRMIKSFFNPVGIYSLPPSLAPKQDQNLPWVLNALSNIFSSISQNPTTQSPFFNFSLFNLNIKNAFVKTADGYELNSAFKEQIENNFWSFIEKNDPHFNAVQNYLATKNPFINFDVNIMKPIISMLGSQPVALSNNGDNLATANYNPQNNRIAVSLKLDNQFIPNNSWSGTYQNRNYTLAIGTFQTLKQLISLTLPKTISVKGLAIAKLLPTQTKFTKQTVSNNAVNGENSATQAGILEQIEKSFTDQIINQWKAEGFDFNKNLLTVSLVANSENDNDGTLQVNVSYNGIPIENGSEQAVVNVINFESITDYEQTINHASQPINANNPNNPIKLTPDVIKTNPGSIIPTIKKIISSAPNYKNLVTANGNSINPADIIPGTPVVSSSGKITVPLSYNNPFIGQNIPLNPVTINNLPTNKDAEQQIANNIANYLPKSVSVKNAIPITVKLEWPTNAFNSSNIKNTSAAIIQQIVKALEAHSASLGADGITYNPKDLTVNVIPNSANDSNGTLQVNVSYDGIPIMVKGLKGVVQVTGFESSNSIQQTINHASKPIDANNPNNPIKLTPDAIKKNPSSIVPTVKKIIDSAPNYKNLTTPNGNTINPADIIPGTPVVSPDGKVTVPLTYHDPKTGQVIPLNPLTINNLPTNKDAEQNIANNIGNYLPKTVSVKNATPASVKSEWPSNAFNAKNSANTQQAIVQQIEKALQAHASELGSNGVTYNPKDLTVSVVPNSANNTDGTLQVNVSYNSIPIMVKGVKSVVQVTGFENSNDIQQTINHASKPIDANNPNNPIKLTPDAIKANPNSIVPTVKKIIDSAPNYKNLTTPNGNSINPADIIPGTPVVSPDGKVTIPLSYHDPKTGQDIPLNPLTINNLPKNTPAIPKTQTNRNKEVTDGINKLGNPINAGSSTENAPNAENNKNTPQNIANKIAQKLGNIDGKPVNPNDIHVTPVPNSANAKDGTIKVNITVGSGKNAVPVNNGQPVTISGYQPLTSHPYTPEPKHTKPVNPPTSNPNPEHTKPVNPPTSNPNPEHTEPVPVHKTETSKPEHTEHAPVHKAETTKPEHTEPVTHHDVTKPVTPPANSQKPEHTKPTTPPASNPQPEHTKPVVPPTSNPNPEHAKPTTPPASNPQPEHTKPVTPPTTNSNQDIANAINHLGNPINAGDPNESADNAQSNSTTPQSIANKIAHALGNINGKPVNPDIIHITVIPNSANNTDGTIKVKITIGSGKESISINDGQPITINGYPPVHVPSKAVPYAQWPQHQKTSSLTLPDKIMIGIFLGALPTVALALLGTWFIIATVKKRKKNNDGNNEK